MFNVLMPYNTEDEEVKIVQAATGAQQVTLRPVISGEELLAAQTVIREVTVPAAIYSYIVDLVAACRTGETTATDFAKEYITWGAGLRASQYIVLGAKSKAALSGRNTVTPADVKAVLTPVLRHRIGMNFRAEVDKVTVEDLIKRLQEAVPAPQ